MRVVIIHSWGDRGEIEKTCQEKTRENFMYQKTEGRQRYRSKSHEPIVSPTKTKRRKNIKYFMEGLWHTHTHGDDNLVFPLSHGCNILSMNFI